MHSRPIGFPRLPPRMRALVIFSATLLLLVAIGFVFPEPSTRVATAACAGMTQNGEPEIRQGARIRITATGCSGSTYAFWKWNAGAGRWDLIQNSPQNYYVWDTTNEPANQWYFFDVCTDVCAPYISMYLYQRVNPDANALYFGTIPVGTGVDGSRDGRASHLTFPYSSNTIPPSDCGFSPSFWLSASDIDYGPNWYQIGQNLYNGSADCYGYQILELFFQSTLPGQYIHCIGPSTETTVGALGQAGGGCRTLTPAAYGVYQGGSYIFALRADTGYWNPAYGCYGAVFGSINNVNMFRSADCSVNGGLAFANGSYQVGTQLELLNSGVTNMTNPSFAGNVYRLYFTQSYFDYIPSGGGFLTRASQAKTCSRPQPNNGTSISGSATTYGTFQGGCSPGTFGAQSEAQPQAQPSADKPIIRRPRVYPSLPTIPRPPLLALQPGQARPMVQPAPPTQVMPTPQPSPPRPAAAPVQPTPSPTPR